MFFFEIEQIFSIPVDQIPYSACTQAWPVRVPILPLQNPHTFFFDFYYSVIPVAFEFLRSFVAKEKKYQLDLRSSFYLMHWEMHGTLTYCTICVDTRYAP